MPAIYLPYKYVRTPINVYNTKKMSIARGRESIATVLKLTLLCGTKTEPRGNLDSYSPLPHSPRALLYGPWISNRSGDVKEYKTGVTHSCTNDFASFVRASINPKPNWVRYI